MDKLVLHDVRGRVDETYVGFKPNGDSVKPVHIANGVFRCILGEYSTSESIKMLALVADSKGRLSEVNSLSVVYNELLEKDAVDDSISKDAFQEMRFGLQRLISVDRGAYVAKGLKDSMISYSAGSYYFVNSRSIYEDAGEFAGDLVRTCCPELAVHVRGVLKDATDSITLLFEPVLGVLGKDEAAACSPKILLSDTPAFENGGGGSTKDFLDSVAVAGNCLLQNMQNNINPLAQLRQFNFFCIFTLMRYLSRLELFYSAGAPVQSDAEAGGTGSPVPIILDFSGAAPHASSVARASEMSYTQMYKSINRFYAWAYSEYFRSEGYTAGDLIQSDTPVYTKGKTTRQKELGTLWGIAKDRAGKALEEDDEDGALLIFGEAVYDMLALESKSYPATYLKALGTDSGILYPPDNAHPNKRFVISQDVLEMLLRCCIRTDETVSRDELRERLWDRFGIIIGGGTFEIQKLKSSGMILQIGEDALEDNFNKFSQLLEEMDFATIMADGILQIHLGR